jgi:hypothetical protein
MPSIAYSDCDIDEGCGDDYDWTILSESGSVSEGGYKRDVSCDYEAEELCEEESVSGDDAASFISQGGYYSDRSDVLTEAEDEGEGVTYVSHGGDVDDEPVWGPEDPVLDAAVRVRAHQFSSSIFRRPSWVSKLRFVLMIIECCSVRKALRSAGLFWKSGCSAGSTDSLTLLRWDTCQSLRFSASKPGEEHQPSCDLCFSANDPRMPYGPSAMRQA